MAGIIRQFDPLAQHGPGLGNCPGPETLEGIVAESFKACLLSKDVEGRQGKLRYVEIWGEDGSRSDGAGVDPHHPADQLRNPVEHHAHGPVRSAVGDDDRGLASCLGNNVQDRVNLVFQGPRHAGRVIRVEAGKRHGDGTFPVGVQLVKDFIPGPGAQPVAGNQNDGACCSCHIPILRGVTDRCMSLFVS